MKSKYERILLVTDGSEAAKSAEQTAKWLAKRDGAEVIITDTIRVQGVVERWLVKNSDEMFKLFEKEKQTRLEQLAKQFAAHGVTATPKLIHGKSSDQITREVIRRDCDLLIRYRKGQDSLHPGKLGKTAMNLIRVCPCPVLIVAEGRFVESPKILACVNVNDRETINENIINGARSLMTKDTVTPEVLYCWSIFGHQMMRRRMSSAAYEALVEDVKQENQQLFDKFVAKHKLDKNKESLHLEYGEAEIVIPKFVLQHSIDITVMSTVAPSSAAVKLLGSTIEHVISELPSSLLAVKPAGFVSPITLEEQQTEDIGYTAPILP